MIVKLRYFASVREMAGMSEEDATIPADLVTIADLMIWLATRHEGLAKAFQASGQVRVAKDFQLVSRQTAIGTPTEIAFFPHFTGG